MELPWLMMSTRDQQLADCETVRDASRVRA